jgi:hypothetical protein
MKIKVTAKGFRLPTDVYKHLNFHMERLSQRLPHGDEDLMLFNFIIRKKGDQSLALVTYQGSINLILPKKPLIVNFEGKTVNQCIDDGINTLKKELQKYKDLHFRSQSKYPNHQTIRGGKNG